MKSRVLPFVGVVLLVMGMCAQVAMAAGTAAGTAISNQASVTYNAGSNQRNATSNTVTLYVAHKVAGAYTPASRTESGVDNRTVYFPVDFVNQGNRADDFSISFNSNTGYTVSMVNDQDGDGVFDTGEPAITSTGSLNADATIHMLVKAIIASGRTDGENVTITATLTSTATDNGNIVVANPGATFGFSISFTVQKPVIAFTATQSDVTSNASRIPGADVTYAMSLDNTSTTGTGVSGSSTVTFVLDPHFKYVSSTQSGSLSGADGNGNGGTVTWTFTQGQLAAAQPAISFDVVVEPEQVTSNGSGVTSGTTVYAMTTGQSTQTKVHFSDGVTEYDQDNANSFNFNVGRAAGCVITQATANGSGDPTATVEYQYTIKNTGNATDSYDFSQANDVTGDLDVAHVFSTTSLGPSVTSISTITQGNTVNFYVRVVIPTNATDGQTIKRDLTATTQVGTPTAPTGGSTSSSDNVTTTVTAPNVSVTLAGGESDIISGGLGGKVVPGTVMRWTVVVTNNGSGDATSVSSSNVNAHLTTNVVDQTSLRIDSDGDGTYETTVGSLPYSSGGITASIGSGILTVGFPSVPSGGGYRGYRYNVTVQ
jgi:trimeric autotransporter adhesin